MVEVQEFYFNSTTLSNKIYAKKYIPCGKPKAIVQFSHGIAGHIGRYDEFFSFLAENGYLAVANDHLGHGHSVSSQEELGFFAPDDGWNFVLRDMDKLHDMIAADYPETPYIFMGHSMGSFLARCYIIMHPDKYDGVILSGTTQHPRALVKGAYELCNSLVKINGPRMSGEKFNDMALKAYGKAFAPEFTPYDWISRDMEQVAKYTSDPLCGFVATISLYRDMLGGILFMSDKENIENMSKKQPVLFISGSADPVGENGKGVERSYKAFCDAGLKDIFMRLYPGGRHEMLNEIDKKKVYADILAWLEEKVPAI